MATTQHLLLSPAELAYLHSTLSLHPPIRPDGRTASQFRPLTAETGILPGTNGSARICFADGTEAIVGVKAEVERTRISPYEDANGNLRDGSSNKKDEDDTNKITVKGSKDWVEVSVEVPGYRDDDSPTVFLSTMLSEALLADGEFTRRLWINRRFHWKMYLDVILISPPLSYPLPLLSLTTHLAILSTRLPRLKSEADEDPMFDDDWDASKFIYPRSGSDSRSTSMPPITLLVMVVGDNIIFDPSKEELAVADCALAVSVGEGQVQEQDKKGSEMDVDNNKSRKLRLLSVRMIDPPSRLTPPGVPNSVNASAWGQSSSGTAQKNPDARQAETADVAGVWKAPRGGIKPAVISAMVAKVLEKGGVADEVLDGLEGVDLG